jgi:hypothetical protein
MPALPERRTAMKTQPEVLSAIEYWVEQSSYEDVVVALIDVCMFWATTESDERLDDTPPARWALRADALLTMMDDDANCVEETL